MLIQERPYFGAGHDGKFQSLNSNCRGRQAAAYRPRAIHRRRLPPDETSV